MSNELKIVTDATCTFCGCVCDDIDISVDVEQNKIVEAKRACVLGKAWFFKLKIADKSELDGLMDEAAYAKHTA